MISFIRCCSCCRASASISSSVNESLATPDESSPHAGPGRPVVAALEPAAVPEPLVVRLVDWRPESGGAAVWFEDAGLVFDREPGRIFDPSREGSEASELVVCCERWCGTLDARRTLSFAAFSSLRCWLLFTGRVFVRYSCSVRAESCGTPGWGRARRSRRDDVAE